MNKTRALIGIITIVCSAMNVTYASDYFNGFEVDTDNWIKLTRVASGTHGIASASGSFHAVSDLEVPYPFTLWGGLNGVPGCAGLGEEKCPGTFPALGYDTSIDIYLDVDGGYENGQGFDFDSSILDPLGNHHKDFYFNCGFYNDDTDSGADGTGEGVNRFICSASNESQYEDEVYPKNPDKMPTVVATTTGWYTFRHRFRANDSGVLTVDLSVLDAVGTVIQTWTLSDPTDLIGTAVGGNGWGWMYYNELGQLAIDNTQRTSIIPADALSHFTIYEVTGGDNIKTVVDLEDQFGTSLQTVKKAKRLLVPVSKNGEEIIDGVTHLVCYEVKGDKVEPKLDVNVVNQFTEQVGDQIMQVKKLKYLCVPSTKEVIEE